MIDEIFFFFDRPVKNNKIKNMKMLEKMLLIKEMTIKVVVC